MREIVIDGATASVRGITRHEIKAMQAEGYPISRWGVTLEVGGDSEKAEAMFDRILELGINDGPPLDLEALTPADERRLYVAIIKETYGAEDEEKNLPPSGDGTQTESE